MTTLEKIHAQDFLISKTNKPIGAVIENIDLTQPLNRYFQ